MLLQIADNLTDFFTGYEDWLTKKDAKLAQIVLVALLPSSWISAFIFYKL